MHRHCACRRENQRVLKADVVHRPRRQRSLVFRSGVVQGEAWLAEAAPCRPALNIVVLDHHAPDNEVTSRGKVDGNDIGDDVVQQIRREYPIDGVDIAGAPTTLRPHGPDVALRPCQPLWPLRTLRPLWTHRPLKARSNRIQRGPTLLARRSGGQVAARIHTQDQRVRTRHTQRGDRGHDERPESKKPGRRHRINLSSRRMVGQSAGSARHRCGRESSPEGSLFDSAHRSWKASILRSPARVRCFR